MTVRARKRKHRPDDDIVRLVLALARRALEDAPAQPFAAWWLWHDGADIAARVGIDPEAWEYELSAAGIDCPAAVPEPKIETGLLMEDQRAEMHGTGRRAGMKSVRLSGRLDLADRQGQRLLQWVQFAVDQAGGSLRAGLTDLLADRQFLLAASDWLGLE